MQDNTGFDTNKAFTYANMWDPYTGEITGTDPYGSLYFHPDELIHYFYIKRLEGLWHEPVDEKAGYYAGYYGEMVGSNLHIEGRGSYAELYLFRLPIVDCYLQNGHDFSIITMGPKLTDDDLKKIDDIASLYYKHDYVKKYKEKRPSLVKMKQLYDQAISSDPETLMYTNINSDIDCTSILYESNIELERGMVNRWAVDKLRMM
jgi:hypothetical protein